MGQQPPPLLYFFFPAPLTLPAVIWMRLPRGTSSKTRTLLLLFSLCAFLSVSAGFSAPSTSASRTLRNANHIFNVIHDSMRQWGSSLHHNGVSFFLATVPAGTQLYHGTSQSTRVNGTEWLAFEPEHAMVFARARRGPRPDPPPEDAGDLDHARRRGELRRRQSHGEDGSVRSVGPPPWEGHDEDESGYLHTYAAAKDLRLVYIDGMSAAKSDKGTLDSQDVVLFNGTLDDPPKGGWQENERARMACELAQHTWEGRIDGVIRMEAGFEIILCAFERDLKLVRITAVPSKQREDGDGRGRRGDGQHGGNAQDEGDTPKPGRGGGPGPDSSRWMRAITARYDGIGGNRVFMNYDHFVTAFTHEVDLFPGDTPLPRLIHLSRSELADLQHELTTLVITHDANEPSHNWQATADMIVTRYSRELAYFVSGHIPDVERLHAEIERLLSPFIDYGARDAPREADRCAAQFLPVQSRKTPTLAARAVHGVAYRICSTLLGAWREPTLESAVRTIQDLVDYLDWTTWKACRGCEDHEICVVPIWPMGTVDDYKNPRCKNASSPYNRDGENYWGGRHFP